MHNRMKSFYITTAIDYPNGNPHMGHAYEKVITDAYARWYRACGIETFFLTGTDENGQKLVKSAEAEKKSTQAYVDENVVAFRSLCTRLEVSIDDFIRTTEERHHRVAREVWERIEKKGDLYEGEYEGQYCLACEAFYTDTQTPEGKCPNHGTPLQKIKEKGFFFRLSSYAKWLEQMIEENPSFIAPEKARKEILQRLRGEPVRDLSVSRPNAGWGIPVPQNENFVMYTWFDALINYLTAVRESPRFEKFWPASMHVIGKDITWFHAVIWPAILKAADFQIPLQVYVHGMVLGDDGRKMSKSLGNGVDPKEVLEKVPVDSFRYYLLRAISSGEDGAFVTADLIARHNSELANDLGNLLSRVVKLAMKKIPSPISLSGVKAPVDIENIFLRMSEAMNRREHSKALDILWSGIHETNLFITRSEPWKLADGSEDLRRVLGGSLLAINGFGNLIRAFLPEVSRNILKALGTEAVNLGQLSEVQTFNLQDPGVLFPKIQ